MQPRLFNISIDASINSKPQHPPGTTPGTHLASELLKIGLFKFLPPGQKLFFFSFVFCFWFFFRKRKIQQKVAKRTTKNTLKKT